MKKLSKLYKINDNTLIKGIKINSKEIQDGDLFVCTKGVNADRHDFVDDAIKNGAKAIVASKDIGKKDVPVVYVEDTNKELPNLSRKFYDYPEKKLKMIGVTGTDGKTTTTTIVQALIGKEDCSYIGTNGVSYKNIYHKTLNTTPDSDKLYMFLDEFIKEGCSYCAMEASSEAFYRGRLDGLEYDVSVFTNISKEHLNVHKTLENYVECKSMLFKQTKKCGFCILNHDDPFYEIIKKSSNGKVLSYGKDKDSTLLIKDYKLFKDHTDITFVYNKEEFNMKSPLLGEFNIYNLAAAILVCFSLNISLDKIRENIKDINVDGRMQVVETNSNYSVIVDYAHTPNGIKNMLDFVNKLKFNRIITVIGSAGGRDPYKRPLMGKVVLDNSSYVIFTSEDPRFENPKDIICDMLKESKDKNNYEIQVNRALAIKKAIDISSENDVVVILGKGNENYQVVKDEIIEFNDVDKAKIAIEQKNNKNKGEKNET